MTTCLMSKSCGRPLTHAEPSLAVGLRSRRLMNKAKGLRTLREITALFDQHGVRFAPVTREIADKLAGGGELTAEERHVLFGGMGSLNDVFITRLNGDKVENDVFRRTTSRMCDLPRRTL